MVCLVRDFFSAELVVRWFVAVLTNSCFPAREGGQIDPNEVLALPHCALPLHAVFVSVRAQVAPACSSEQVVPLLLVLLLCVRAMNIRLGALCLHRNPTVVTAYA